MNNKLSMKFVVGYILILLTGFILVAMVFPDVIRKRLVNDVMSDMRQDASRVVEDGMKDLYGPRSSGISEEKLLVELHDRIADVSQYTDKRIILVDANTQAIIMDSDSSLDETRYKHMYGFDVASYTGYPVYSVSMPLEYSFRVLAYVTVSIDKSEIDKEVYRINRVNYLVYLCMFVLSFVLFIIYVFEVERPIRAILKVTKKYEDGSYDARIKPHDSEDDIGKLAMSLNYIATEFGEIEAYEKNFIANVSHDFRSPLTSIKGYLEAMLDGTIPPDMQEKYLNIVIAETERLNKLTSSILSLSDMDRKSISLDITTFSINQVIKQVIETFGGICRGKDIQFELEFSDEDVKVKGDLEKIKQVMYNLVDNAIKFSPNNSSIRISVADRNGKVYISVKDHGIGIPKADIPKIWDRFYKTDLSRGKDKKGSGLGLSIVKDIITAHKSNIDVTSTVSGGTEFTFFLPEA
ncbi:MAG: HAMP domain-containing histidine kinase [Lachnospiraceae bacterium]|nr:HAMP domain-containing histidine kinase [Lachnospiraceae bacterium]